MDLDARQYWGLEPSERLWPGPRKVAHDILLGCLTVRMSYRATTSATKLNMWDFL